MFCSRCGLRVEEGARYCQACGQQLVPSATPPPIPAIVPLSAPQYAGFWVRFVARLIDGLILGIPFFLMVIGPIFRFRRYRLLARGGSFGPPDPAFVVPIIFGIVFVGTFFLIVKWLYFAGMESSAGQATFGKAAMSLRVTDLQGRRLSFGRATGRFFAKIISGRITLGIGYIMAGFTQKKQALHDMIAGTLVVRKF